MPCFITDEEKEKEVNEGKRCVDCFTDILRPPLPCTRDDTKNRYMQCIDCFQTYSGWYQGHLKTNEVLEIFDRRRRENGFKPSGKG